FGGYILAAFMLPALLDGKPGLGVAVVGASAIMFVVLYLAHGVSIRTSAALAGTLVGVGITALIGLLAIHQSRLSGISNETGALQSGFVHDLNFQGLLTCAVIIAGLGVLNDVTITQASAVWELRGAAPDLDRRALFSRAMRIGRDHIASTIYTIVFAYAGAALSVLLLLYFYQRPVLSLVSTEDISEEIVRTLASGIGLVLAVPITTAMAALTVGGARRDASGGSAVRSSAPTGRG
ncbi:MAG: YibE/F family protein, partial [Actinomycetota bacterium]|nr:YibE/F family protein [Actinomycetota bacterium]